MKSILKRIGISALLGFVTVFPFALMELVNRREYHEVFPFSLFIGMWSWQVVFVFALWSVIRKIRAAENTRARLVGILLGLVILSLVAWIWIGFLRDQMPCFLGVRICD
jgi:hypothetical protein